MHRSVFLRSSVALAAAFAGRMPAARAADRLGAGPFTIVAPFAAGGPVDSLARLLAAGLASLYKQPAIVDNRPGASGNIGIGLVKRAKPDGHTLLVVPQGNLTINPTLMPRLPYSVSGDFEPVASMGRTANVIAVHPGVPATTLQALVALSRGRPGTLSYASPGVGSSLHLAGELLKERTGADLLHVAYKGSTLGLNDVLAGSVPIILSNLPVVLPYLRSDKLRALAVTDAVRSELLPDVPTLAEAGVQGVALSSWYGVLAPKGTPSAVVVRLADDVEAILQAPAAQNQLGMQGITPWVIKGRAFGELIAAETAMWAPIIERLGIQTN